MAMLAMAMYLFIVVAYLFFVPAFQYKCIKDNSIIKTNTQLIYTLVRTNRGLTNGDTSTRIKVKQFIASDFLQRVTVSILTSLPFKNSYTLTFLPNHHFSYLYNCVLRV